MNSSVRYSAMRTSSLTIAVGIRKVDVLAHRKSHLVIATLEVMITVPVPVDPMTDGLGLWKADEETVFLSTTWDEQEAVPTREHWATVTFDSHETFAEALAASKTLANVYNEARYRTLVVDDDDWGKRFERFVTHDIQKRFAKVAAAEKPIIKASDTGVRVKVSPAVSAFAKGLTSTGVESPKRPARKPTWTWTKIGKEGK